MLNALVYIDDKDLLSTFLTLIECAGEKVKLCFQEDIYGFTPFQIAQQGRINDCHNLLINFCIKQKKINLIDEFLPANQLQYLHDNEGALNANAVELINELSFSPLSLEKYDKGFNVVTKTTFNTTQPTISMFEDRLYYDELSEEKYSYGKWFVFPIKGVLSPCNDWCQSLRKLPMTSKIFQPSKIVPLISEMKWKLYARKLFWREFLFLLFLIGCFLTEIFWLHYKEVNESRKKLVGNIFHGAMAFQLLGFIKTELRQMSYSVKEYFNNWSNYIDLLFILSIGCYIVINFAFQFENVFTVRMFGATALIFSWIKVVIYLRALSGFAFIMLMLISVFNDMKYFLAILIWILLGFSFSFGMLQQRNLEQSQDIFHMIKISHKVLLGDFDAFDEVMQEEVTGSEVCVWLFFFFCTLLLMIIMLNLLIAFINDSYENLIQSKDIAFFSERIGLIAYIEREMTGGQRDYLETKYGDQFFFYFQLDQGEEDNANFETKRIRDKLDDIHENQKKQFCEIKDNIDELKKELKNQLKDEIGSLKVEQKEQFVLLREEFQKQNKN